MPSIPPALPNAISQTRVCSLHPREMQSRNVTSAELHRREENQKGQVKSVHAYVWANSVEELQVGTHSGPLSTGFHFSVGQKILGPGGVPRPVYQQTPEWIYTKFKRPLETLKEYILPPPAAFQPLQPPPLPPLVSASPVSRRWVACNCASPSWRHSHSWPPSSSGRSG